ncbi:MAG: sigma 54-interacting transcriptional regulator [Exilibacterium sp.]
MFLDEFGELEPNVQVRLLRVLQESTFTPVGATKEQAFDAAIDLLRADINDLPDTSIAVKRELRVVHQLQQTGVLKALDAKTQHLLTNTIAPLMSARVLPDKRHRPGQTHCRD